TRSVAHNYNETWSKDATNHWIECSVCKDKKDLATHAPGAEATETTPQIWTICGYIIKPALNHTHSFATEWTTDDVGHWHACSGCEEKDSYAAHTWENGSCSVCGAVNTNATQPTTTPTEGQEPTTAPTEQPDTNKTEEKGNNIIWIIVVIVVLASAAVVVFIILKKQGLISK
ncbi:MAG: DUF4366 domain-containing protein, partial [Oscillospiraceae bacterium]|nr:DUF4366 domain-containing protein [Oscillospiraceae bacterium]